MCHEDILKCHRMIEDLFFQSFRLCVDIQRPLPAACTTKHLQHTQDVFQISHSDISSKAKQSHEGRYQLRVYQSSCERVHIKEAALAASDQLQTSVGTQEAMRLIHKVKLEY